jgi:hypothetical protein
MPSRSRLSPGRFDRRCGRRPARVVVAADSGNTWTAKVVSEKPIHLGVPVLAIHPQCDLAQFLSPSDHLDGLSATDQALHRKSSIESSRASVPREGRMAGVWRRSRSACRAETASATAVPSWWTTSRAPRTWCVSRSVRQGGSGAHVAHGPQGERHRAASWPDGRGCCRPSKAGRSAADPVLAPRGGLVYRPPGLRVLLGCKSPGTELGRRIAASCSLKRRLPGPGATGNPCTLPGPGCRRRWRDSAHSEVPPARSVGAGPGWR